MPSTPSNQAQSYEDKRCKCICPSLSSVLNNTNEKDRMMIIENVPPHKWYAHPPDPLIRIHQHI